MNGCDIFKILSRLITLTDMKRGERRRGKLCHPLNLWFNELPLEISVLLYLPFLRLYVQFTGFPPIRVDARLFVPRVFLSKISLAFTPGFS